MDGEPTTYRPSWRHGTWPLGAAIVLIPLGVAVAMGGEVVSGALVGLMGLALASIAALGPLTFRIAVTPEGLRTRSRLGGGWALLRWSAMCSATPRRLSLRLTSASSRRAEGANNL